MEIVGHITNATSFHSSCSSFLQDYGYCVLVIMAIMKGGTDNLKLVVLLKKSLFLHRSIPKRCF